MEEVVLRLVELLFPSVADVAVLSVDVNNETVRIEARCTTAGARVSRLRELVESGSWLLPALSR